MFTIGQVVQIKFNHQWQSATVIAVNPHGGVWLNLDGRRLFRLSSEVR